MDGCAAFRILTQQVLCSSHEVTLSIDDEVIRRARYRAEALGTSVDQLIRDYLEQLAGRIDPIEDAAAFERLSRLAQGDSSGWKFNREEVHERR